MIVLELLGFWVGSYLFLQLIRFLALFVFKKGLPDFCPFCVATTVAWVAGLLQHWPLPYTTLLLGVNLFDYTIRYKYYLKSKGFKQADYIKQAILLVACTIIIFVLWRLS